MTQQEAELRQALAAGPTRGPWAHRTYQSGTQNVEYPGARGVATVDQVFSADEMSVCHETSSQALPFVKVDHRPEDRKQEFDVQRHKNARYIAAASPDVVSALLAELDQLRKAAACAQN
jgi:hypothetical protein